nr:MAG TPA: hypothetical protein [Caudoviricetes sp.]
MPNSRAKFRLLRKLCECSCDLLKANKYSRRLLIAH